MSAMHGLRCGIDLGGTKIEGVVLAADGRVLLRERVATPSGSYGQTVETLTSLVHQFEQSLDVTGLPVGLCTPGAISPMTGRIKNANSTCLNGQPLQADLEQALSRPIRLANDADCLAVSEAADGAGRDAYSVFGVILGTGVGGGIVINGKLHHGPNAIAGEWGHNPLPWPKQDFNEWPGRGCYCGNNGCIETWLSGPGLSQDHGGGLTAPQIAQQAAADEWSAQAALSRYEDRLARALASVINVLDPEVIVLGGGLSHIDRLYRHVPLLWGDYVFSDRVDTRLCRAQHGDASGVRGAAWLWS